MWPFQTSRESIRLSGLLAYCVFSLRAKVRVRNDDSICHGSAEQRGRRPLTHMRMRSSRATVSVRQHSDLVTFSARILRQAQKGARVTGRGGAGMSMATISISVSDEHVSLDNKMECVHTAAGTEKFKEDASRRSASTTLRTSEGTRRGT